MTTNETTTENKKHLTKELLGMSSEDFKNLEDFLTEDEEVDLDSLFSYNTSSWS